MKILFLLLAAILPIHAVSLSYNPDSLEFSFSDNGISYSSRSGSFRAGWPMISVGSLSNHPTERLLSPFEPDTLSADGIIAGEEENNLFILYSPSFAAGWNLSRHGFELSAAYAGRGNVSERLFLDVPSRGGSEGVHLHAGYTHEYFSLSVKSSLTEASGFDIMMKASLSCGGVTFVWSEGSAAAYAEDRNALRRRIELVIKGGALRYDAHLSFGREPYISGSFRSHEGRERVSVKLSGIEIGALHQASFSSDGKYEQSSEYYLKYKSITAGFDSGLNAVARYDDGTFRAGFRGKSFYYGYTFISDSLKIKVVVTSEGAVSSSITLVL